MACTRSTLSLSSRSFYASPNTPSSFLKNLPILASRARTCICMSSSLSSSSASMPMSVPTATPMITANDALLKYIRQPRLFPVEEDEGSKRRDYLLEKIGRQLQSTEEAVEKLKLIDTIQRLGIAYYLEDRINVLLQAEFSNASSTDDDLFTTALRFRLLRHNGFQISPDVFLKFMDKNGKFKESLTDDKLGLLSLYEASYVGSNGEENIGGGHGFHKNAPPTVAQALELPRHLRMARLEARRFIEQYAAQSDCHQELVELAILDYNKVQAQHQMELAEITRWWTQLGLVDKLTFARDRPLECFLWSVGLLPEPKYSTCRIELAKTIAILLVIDDIFDTYGKMDELVLFTDAIRRWDLEAMETLPEYMKICYMALYNTTNEICYKVLKQNGWSVLPYLKSTWIDMIEGFMVEAKWFNGGSAPNLEEYIENGVSTAGAYMALVHLFFLIGEGVTDQNARLLFKPYPKLFSAAGRILRLWDDLGTAKEEEERGDLASSIHLFMREKKLATEEEGRSRILEEIYGLWKDLNGELIAKNGNGMPLAITKVALNMARASQVVYKHEEDTYFSSVDNYVEALFFTPLHFTYVS
ncbi:Geraniol synthase, chloroplastic [Sesamum alatum]|uniref:Geraniol synthase, chloroplastic n=1 Tax=Sesamum alatum TaxID=300844 RepID=A0AAE2CF40_9LAMI|nr:Geraniol synthase, chloroplastic [Sesamum alatum]